MLSIIDGGSLRRVLSLDIQDCLKELLRFRCEQLGGDPAGQARFVVMQPGDELEALDQELSFSVFQNPVWCTTFGEPDFAPAWEWAADHGFAYELVFIFDDSGFAHVVIVEQAEWMHPKLLKLCADYATAQA